MSSIKPPQPGVGPTVRRAAINAPDETDVSYVLSVIEGPDVGKSFTLDASSPTRALIGSSPVCTVRLTDQEVSRRHAALAIAATHVQLIDLDSTNGTTVNGVTVKEVSLKGGEAIRMGATVLGIQRGHGSPESKVGEATSWGRIIGQSLAMRRLYPAFETLAKSDRSVLIEGEAGTGKELLAEELHRASKRAEGPFIVLEASGIPAEQIATRLFGPLEGETPLVERAKGGVLFIDEIGDVPRHAQKKLRDMITAGGSGVPDVRLIVATKRDLDRDVTAGRFDDAFFFELSSGRVELPRLRDRQGDVALLARTFWKEHSQDELPVDLLPRFENYPWPGNVRELRAVVQQRATFGELSKTYLSDRAGEQGHDFVTAVIQEGLAFPAARDRVVWEFERRYVEAVLAKHNGNVGAAARASGVAHRYFQLVRARVR
jgi:DNA-binding NtrC family response regulator